MFITTDMLLSLLTQTAETRLLGLCLADLERHSRRSDTF